MTILDDLSNEVLANNKKLKREIPKISDKEILRNITLTCVEKAEDIIQIMLKKHEFFYKKLELESNLINLQKVKPIIIQQQELEELRKYALTGVDMLEKVVFGLRGKNG